MKWLILLKYPASPHFCNCLWTSGDTEAALLIFMTSVIVLLVAQTRTQTRELKHPLKNACSSEVSRVFLNEPRHKHTLESVALSPGAATWVSTHYLNQNSPPGFNSAHYLLSIVSFQQEHGSRAAASPRTNGILFGCLFFLFIFYSLLSLALVGRGWVCGWPQYS